LRRQQFAQRSFQKFITYRGVERIAMGGAFPAATRLFHVVSGNVTAPIELRRVQCAIVHQ